MECKVFLIVIIIIIIIIITIIIIIIIINIIIIIMIIEISHKSLARITSRVKTVKLVLVRFFSSGNQWLTRHSTPFLNLTSR